MSPEPCSRSGVYVSWSSVNLSRSNSFSGSSRPLIFETVCPRRAADRSGPISYSLPTRSRSGLNNIVPDGDQILKETMRCPSSVPVRSASKLLIESSVMLPCRDGSANWGAMVELTNEAVTTPVRWSTPSSIFFVTHQPRISMPVNKMPKLTMANRFVRLRWGNGVANG